MFRKKSLRKLAVFRVVLQNKGRKRIFLGKRQEKGDIQGTRPSCHGGGLGSKTGPYRGKTKPWRGETRAGEQRKWGVADGNKSLLRLGSYFLLIIYIAQERRKWPLRARAPPPALLGEAKNPSPILRDGLGIRSGWKAVRGQVDFSCKRTDLVIARRLGSKVGVKNEVNFVAL